MIDAPADAWFAAHTDGAPEALRARSTFFFHRAPAGEVAERLAHAGRAALLEATRDGAGRAAALDLLAADALITLALLSVAERDPGRLGATATALRSQAAATS